MNEQLHYVFDPAGNLDYRTNNTLIENFQVNTLNELTTNTNSGRLTVMGTTTSPATKCDRERHQRRALQRRDVRGDEHALDDDLHRHRLGQSGPAGHQHRDREHRHQQRLYQYDGNGNLINDGLRSFAYDDENQLIQVWVTNQWLTQFTYDGKMRRRIRQECAWQSGVWVQTNEVYYVYDGNLVIQERDVNNLPTTTYTRGKDLSGSLEGRGRDRGIAGPRHPKPTPTRRCRPKLIIIRTATGT